MKTTITYATLFAGLFGFTAGLSDAALIKITGVNALASTEDTGRTLAQHTVDESGFDPATHTVTATGGNDTMWTSANGVTQADTWIRFDTGEVQTISEMWVFNYNGDWRTSERRRLVTADIWYADTTPTVNNPTDAEPGNWTKLLNDQAFTEAPYTTTYNTPDKLELNISSRYVLISDIVNAGAAEWGNSYGLSEVEFFAIPEPSTLSLAAIALLGLMRRSRSRMGPSR